jgi:salicylate hydroxylase
MDCYRVIHRAEYQALLLENALNSGARLLKDAEVIGVDDSAESEYGTCTVSLKDGRQIGADVIIGADGLIKSSLFRPDRISDCDS